MKKSSLSVLTQFLHIMFLCRPNIEMMIKARHLEYRQVSAFESFAQLNLMVYAHIAGLSSLRSIVATINSMPNRYKQLGLKSPPNKSTLSYANSHRDWEFFRDVFILVREKIQLLLSRHKIDYKPIFIDKDLIFFDATTIDLCLNVFKWAHYTHTKGAVKIHTAFDGYLPVLAVVTYGKVGDVTALESLIDNQIAHDTLIIEGDDEFAGALEHTLFPIGSVLCIDRGYIKFSLFKKINDCGLFFVTRAKIEMSYNVLENLPVPKDITPADPDAAVVISDQIIEFRTKKAKADCPMKLRLVTASDQKSGRKFTFLTNLFEPQAHVISAIYKRRWLIESFFKTIKQHTKIKSFVGVSENAVKTQIWAALIAIEIALYQKLISHIKWDFSNLVEVIRVNLFFHIDLREMIDNPLHMAEPPPPPGIQFNKLF